MFREKEALIINIMKTIDAITIIVAFIYAYFVDYWVRSIYDFRDLAYAIAPNLNGLLFYAKMNLPFTLSFVPIWIMLLSMLGFYKDFRTRPFSHNFKIIIKVGVLSIFGVSRDNIEQQMRKETGR